MAGEEGERVGGIYVDVGIEDEGVLARLNQIAEAMAKLADRETTVKVKLVEEGSTTPKRAQNKKSVLPATFELEKDAAEKAVKNVEAVAIPITLALATDAISKLKAQINEAFNDFSVKVKVQYAGGTPSEAQDEFAEATGLGGGGTSRTKRVTRSTGPRQPQAEAPAFDRFHALVRNVSVLETAQKELAELKKSPNTSQRTLNEFSALISKATRNVNRYSYTPEGQLPEERRTPEPAPRPMVERERRAYRHDPRVAKAALPTPEERTVLAERRAADIEQRTGFAWPTTRAAERVPPTPVGPRPDLEPLSPLVAPRRRPRQQGMSAAQRDAYEAEEAAQQRAAREAAMLSGRRAGETGGGGFAPRVGPERDFDRTPLTTVPGARGAVTPGPAVAVEGVQTGESLVIRGPIQRAGRARLSPYARRRQGPERTYAQDPAAGRRGPGFFEARPANRVRTVADENALGVIDPARFALLERYRKGEFGTIEEPMVEELKEGRRVGPLRPLTDPQRRKALKDAGNTAYGTTFSAGRYRIANPKAIFKEESRALGEISPLAERLIFGAGGERGTLPEAERVGLLGSPKYKPGTGISGGEGRGGYVNVAGGPGGAARSALDTPEGNAANRARIENERYRDAYRKLKIEDPEFAAVIRGQSTVAARRQMLEPYLAQTGGDINETRALMKASPREFGFNQRRLTAAFQRFQGGYAERTGLQGYLAEDKQATPASVYNAFVRKYLDEFKTEFGYKQSAKLKSLPEPVQALVSAQAAKVRETTGFTVPDYERTTATGGAGKRFIPGTMEEAAARIEPAGRATTKTRERRRDYGPAESQLAEIRSRLERLEGTPEQLRTAVQRGMATEGEVPVGRPDDVGYIPGAPGTAEEQRRSRQGGATQVNRGRLGEIDTSRLLLREVQARAARKTKQADEIRAVLTGTKTEEDPTKARRLIERVRGYGVNIPEGGGLPGGAMAGIDVTPAANIGEARSRLARALVQRRGYRRMLPASYAAAETERQELRERGVDLSGQPIISDKTPPTGDELIAKITGQPTIGRRVRGVTRPAVAAAAEPISIAAVRAARQEAPEIQARRAAEDREPAVPLTTPGGPPPPEEARTTLGPTGGGPVPVDIVASIPLPIEGGAGAVAGKTAKTEAKASEAKEPPLKAEPFVARERQRAQLIRSLQAQGLDIQAPEAGPRPFTGKSPARIQAESEILEARALSPTRAFQTAVAAAFAKTFGGGGEFEKRVKGLQGSLNRRADIADELGDTGRQLRATSLTLASARKRIVAMDAAGEKVPRELRAFAANLETERHQLIDTAVAQRQQRQEATAEVAARRKSLISPVGVVRGFTALGAGAIAGGLIFSAASQAIQAVLGTLEEGASRAADSLSSFAITAQKVSQELASAVHASFGDVRGAVAGAAAPSGIGAAAFERLVGPLGGRAGAVAAAQGRVQESDLFRTSASVGRNAFDAALFQGTGGILNGPLFAPQPGFLERINADLANFNREPQRAQFNLQNRGVTQVGRFGVGSPRSALEAVQGPSSSVGNFFPVTVTRDLENFRAYVADLNEQLGKVNSNFEVLSDATQAQKDAMIKSAEAIGRGEDAKRLAEQGVAITARGGGGLAGTQFGTAIEDLARGQNQVTPQVAVQADRRAIEAQVRQLYRQRDYALQESIPRQLSLEALAAPAMPVGTGIAPEDRSSVAADLKEANALQTQLNQRYAEGTQLLKDAIPKDLYDSIESTGKAIADIQTTISNAQAALQVHEYNNQLFIAKRTYTDILGLQGKSVHQGASHLGVLERQNVELSRQSEALQRMLQQRQINFQLATAGFIVAGQSPEERAARIKDAKTQAEFAQKQLDISTKAAKNNIRIFDLQNINSARDALAAIGLLREGRQVTIQTKAAEEKLQRLNKLQADNVKRAGKYIEAVEGEVAIAQSEIYKLEATYGKAIDSITRDTIQGFIKVARAIANNMPFASGEQNGTDRIVIQGTTGKTNASGFLGTVSGATNMIMGEAGTETVAILRNARTITATGGGGGGVIININGPVVREDSDIQKITRAVMNALNTRTALLGLR